MQELITHQKQLELAPSRVQELLIVQEKLTQEFERLENKMLEEKVAAKKLF